MDKQFYVYILTNKNDTVLYTGVTNNLQRRVYEHKEKIAPGFTKKYNISKLVYYEIFEDPENAILREKKIKAGSRQKKIDLINSHVGKPPALPGDSQSLTFAGIWISIMRLYLGMRAGYRPSPLN